VQWVPVTQVVSNNYNPNRVAATELKLLHLSIRQDGFTMPIVCYRDERTDKFIVVDGFHRLAVVKRYKDINDANNGHVPIVVIDKPLSERIASTIRHNRARGKHTVDGMGNIVIQLLNNGWSDLRICEELGLDKEELVRLKHVSGYAKFFENVDFSRAMMTDTQIREGIKFRDGDGK
jgi:ParB-like chromosome segregation protein Spo0J